MRAEMESKLAAEKKAGSEAESARIRKEAEANAKAQMEAMMAEKEATEEEKARKWIRLIPCLGFRV